MTTPTTSEARTPDPGRGGLVAVPGHAGLALAFDRRGDAVELELVGADGTGPAPELVASVVALVDAVLARPELADATAHLAAEHPPAELDPLPEAVADAAGYRHRRDLLQLRRPLPVEADHPLRAAAPTVATRPFTPGADDAAWIRVNNRAFAGHPDQGAESAATLAARSAEGWFDPAGFLVADDADRPGELAGFCWTKVHAATDADPALGEIYVIGVDPSHRGEGLGPSFTLAGLDHLAAEGLGTANLYVDADNEPARRLYDRLGFATHTRRRVYTS